MATAKQRAWRAKFARLYGGGRKKRSQRSAAPVKRSRRMARYRGFRRRSRSRGSGMNGLIKGALMGGLASFIAPKLGINFNPLVLGAAGGYLLGGKSINGALGGVVGSYAAGMFLGGTTSADGWERG